MTSNTWKTGKEKEPWDLTNYPTEKAIMRKQITFPKELIDAVKSWKKQWYRDWKYLKNSRKNVAIQDLVFRISITMHDKLAPKMAGSDKYAYIHEFQTILVDVDKPSIISTLHELGHHINGSSELQACRWSTQLFQQCFPRTFKTLKWKGHLLVK